MPQAYAPRIDQKQSSHAKTLVVADWTGADLDITTGLFAGDTRKYPPSSALEVWVHNSGGATESLFLLGSDETVGEWPVPAGATFPIPFYATGIGQSSGANLKVTVCWQRMF